MKPLDKAWPVTQAVELACILEASSPKLGNVHPAASFHDMHFGHFLASAAAIAPLFTNLENCRVGRLVLEAVAATRCRAGCNTNLGTLLLLAPLAIGAERLLRSGHQPTMESLRKSTCRVLAELDASDSRDIYDAIRIASPGGLGQSKNHDVYSEAPSDLIEAMRQVSEGDAVARQYVNGFEDIFLRLWPWLLSELRGCDNPLAAIVRLQVRWLAYEPDGLIVRKLGLEEGKLVQRLAGKLFQTSQCNSADFAQQFQELDFYLRDVDHSRNPGTTADLIAATLFCQLVAVAE